TATSGALSGISKRLLEVSTFQGLGTHFIHAHTDDFVGCSTHLEAGNTKSTVEQLATAESGGVADTVQFFLQLGDFVIQSRTLGITIGTVGRLQAQVTHTLQDIGGLLQRTFSGLRHGDAVVGVLHRNVQTADLAAQTVGDLQAGGIVLGTVDTATSGQTLHGGLQRVGGVAQVALSVQGSNVSVDGQSHDKCPPSDLACLPECATLGRERTQAPIKFAFEVYVGGGFESFRGVEENFP